MKGKKAMEMWQLILMLLAVIFLIFMIIWFSDLDETVAHLLEKLGDSL